MSPKEKSKSKRKLSRKTDRPIPYLPEKKTKKDKNQKGK
jgi:hypothetical protein